MGTYRKCALRTQAAWDAMSTEEQAEYDAHYTDMESWSIGEATDLVSSSLGDSVLECFDDWPSGLPWTYYDSYTHGWSVDADNHIIIRAAEGHGHGGVIGDGFFLLGPAGNSPRIRELTTYEDITFKGADYTSVCPYGYSYNLIANRCIFHRMDYVRLTPSGNLFNNCIFYDFISYPQSSSTFNNCLFYKITENIVDDRVLRDGVVYNCIGWISGNKVSGYDIFYLCTGNNNISKDQSAPFTPPNVEEIGWTDEDNGDFTITNTSVLYDKGRSISGLVDDILGNSRPQGSANDIGPFEVIVQTPIELKSVVIGSSVGIINLDTDTNLISPFVTTTTDTSLEVSLSGTTNISIRIRKSGYLPYRSDIALTSEGITLFVAQTEDSIVN